MMNALDPGIPVEDISGESCEDSRTTVSDPDGSSTSSPEPEHVAGPWTNWSPHQRQSLELSFTMQTNFPINQDWMSTEKYVLAKDAEMLRYLADFPICNWLIARHEALAAYYALLERHRLREKGLSIFSGGKPAWWPISHSITSTHTIIPPTTQRYRIQVLQPPIGYPVHPGFTPVNSAPYMTNIVPHAIPHAHSVSEQIRILREESRVLPRRTFPNTLPSTYPLPRPPVPLFPPHHASQSNGQIPQHVNQGPPQPRKQPPQAITQSHNADFEPKTAIQEHPRHDQSVQEPETDLQPPIFKPKPQRASRHSAVRETVEYPPYPVRERPSAVEEAENGPTRQRRRASLVTTDKPEFPWQNSWAHETPMKWDDSIYPASRLQSMEAVRVRNQPKIDQYYKGKENVKTTKKSGTQKDGEDSDAEQEVVEGTVKKMRPKPRKRHAGEGSANDDPYHSSHLLFNTDEDRKRCTELGCIGIRDALKAAMFDPTNDAYGRIEVYMDPGDRPLINDLEIAPISVLDIARTRLQLEHLRVFPEPAGWRMIDFCPDMLHEYNLLKVVGETSSSNGMIRERLSSNGFPCSDSTITKRVTSAVEKKKDSKAGSVANDMDKEWRKLNRADHNKYKSFHLNRRAKSNNLESPTTFNLATAGAQHMARMAQEAQEAHDSQEVQEGRADRDSSVPSTMTVLSSGHSSPTKPLAPQVRSSPPRHSPPTTLPPASESTDTDMSDPHSTIKVNTKRHHSELVSPSSSKQDRTSQVVSPPAKRRNTRRSTSVSNVRG